MKNVLLIFVNVVLSVNVDSLMCVGLRFSEWYVILLLCSVFYVWFIGMWIRWFVMNSVKFISSSVIRYRKIIMCLLLYFSLISLWKVFVFLMFVECVILKLNIVGFGMFEMLFGLLVRFVRLFVSRWMILLKLSVMIVR